MGLSTHFGHQRVCNKFTRKQKQWLPKLSEMSISQTMDFVMWRLSGIDFRNLFLSVIFPNPSHSFLLFLLASNTVTTFTTPRRGQDIVFYTPKRSTDNK